MTGQRGRSVFIKQSGHQRAVYPDFARVNAEDGRYQDLIGFLFQDHAHSAQTHSPAMRFRVAHAS